jgi:hypothetical protein
MIRGARIRRYGFRLGRFQSETPPNGLSTIANRLGITVIQGMGPREDRYFRAAKGPRFHPELPDKKSSVWSWRDDWVERCPDKRCDLPEYVPDVTGGHSAPVALTTWKIQAIKVAILLETKGFVTRADIKALKIDPSRWTQFWLRNNGEGGWVRTDAMPDFKAQHPINYEQIRADFEKWAPPTGNSLFGTAA